MPARYCEHLTTCLVFLWLAGILPAVAADKAVVIPWSEEDFLVIPLPDDKCPDPAPPNSILVDKSGGDFSDPEAAIDSILDAAADNLYLICIGPGTYQLSRTLVMKQYVDIRGSGEGVTTLSGPGASISFAGSAVVSGADNATLSMLSIETGGGVASSIGIYNAGVSPAISGITIISDGQDINYGVYNTSSSPSMTDMTVTATGGDIHYAVYNTGSAPSMTDMTATATGGDINYAVYNTESSPSMTNVTAVATGGDINRAVVNLDSTPMIHQSTLDGSSKSGNGLVSKDGSTATVSESVIKGGVVADDSTNICTDTVNGGGVTLNPDCTLPP